MEYLIKLIELRGFVGILKNQYPLGKYTIKKRLGSAKSGYIEQFLIKLIDLGILEEVEDRKFNLNIGVLREELEKTKQYDLFINKSGLVVLSKH